MGAMMSLVLFFLRRNYPTSIQGLAEWSAAPFILFVSTLLAGGRGVLPDAVSIVLANMLLITGLYLFYRGTQRFHGQPPDLRLGIALVVFAGAWATWFGLVAPNYRARLLMINPLLALLFLLQVRLLWIHGRHGFSRGFTLAILLAGAAIQIARFILELLVPTQSADTLTASPLQLFYLTAYALIMLLFTICLVLLATERLRLEFQHLATHDSLTDAFTRRHLSEACSLELERSRRQGREMSLLVMDIDHFKSVNDRFGHQAGDRVLIEFVACVRRLLRRPDQLGRFGGEEFVVLLPETPGDMAGAVAERIRAAVAESATQPRCTVSIGVTTSRPDDQTVDTLLARADAAMYRAKEQGRNRVVVAQ